MDALRNHHLLCSVHRRDASLSSRSVCSLLLFLLLPTAGLTQETDSSYPSLVAEPVGEPFFQGPVPRTAEILADAALHDVDSVGSHVWAVGDRGVLVRSRDGGQTWQTHALPVDAQLTAASFLTDRIGFVGACVYDPAARRFVGMILKTSDGGDRWSVAAGSQSGTLFTDTRGRTKSGLPPVSWMKFFDLRNAVAVCSQADPTAQSLVLRTEDGGATWQPFASGDASGAWHSAAFVTPAEGVVVGRGNSYAAVVGEQLVGLADRTPVASRVHAAAMSSDGNGWLVGDGGMMLCSQNGGISWKPPAERMPASLNNVLDFYDVAEHNGRVCVVGRPGTSVLLADASGRNWSVGRLSGSVPLRSVCFVSDEVLLAVGELGVIHRSTDAGRTWQPVRNAGFRAAVLVMTPDPQDVSHRMLAGVAGEQGFRTVVSQLSPRLLPGKYDDSADELVRHAISQSGGNAFETEWMFVRNQPRHAMVRDALMSSWSLQTDGNVDRLLPARLAEQIMTWRPDVICVEARSGEQLSDVILDVLPQALQLAAGLESTPESQTLSSVGLKPWRVQRVVVRQPDGTSSPLTYRGDQLLPRLRTSVDLVADHGRRQLVTPRPFVKPPASDAYLAWESGTAVATPARLLSGIDSAPGTVSRRAIKAHADHDPAALAELIRKKQAERSALIGQAQQTATPLAVIGSLQQIGRDLPPALALRQLQELAELYAARQNLDAEIAILKEIARRFPERPETADAAEKLFLYYSSSELRMLRRRENQAATTPGPALGRIPGIVAAPQQLSGTSGSVIQQTSGISKPPIRQPGTGTAFANNQGRVESSVDIQWDRNARAAWELLHRIAPARATSPQMLIRQAANLFRADSYAQSRTVLSRASTGDGLYAFLALAEMQGEHGLAETPLPILHVMPADTAPFLDGDLSDLCWQDAKEIRLESAATGGPETPSCLLMMTWDNQYVYLAGRVQRSPRSAEMDHTQPRRHDADHGTRDRVEFSFDLDRDYTTAFHFVLDDAGQTSEHCWGKRDWNPQWYVAAESDQDVWRFEVAIPVRELQSSPLSAGSLWTTEIRRVVPGEVEQRVVTREEVVSDPAAAGRGLLRFLRPRR